MYEHICRPICVCMCVCVCVRACKNVERGEAIHEHKFENILVAVGKEND
jgi:hypothetical protein